MNDRLRTSLLALKALLLSEAAPVVEENPVEFKDVKSKDGKSYKVSALEAGASIQVVDEAGVSAPAPDGEISLEDGSVITVKDGKIESVKPAEQKPEDKPADAPTAPQFKAEDFVAVADFTALQTSFNDLKAKFEAVSRVATTQGTQISAMFEVVEAISNESEVKPTDAPKHSAFSAIKSEKEIAQEKLRKAIIEANKK